MAELNKLSEVVTRVSDTGPLLTIQPGGNYGDSLIYKGAEKFFDEEIVPTIPLRPGAIRDDTPPPVGFGSLPDIYNTAQNLSSQIPYVKHRITSDISAVYIHGGGNFNDVWGSGIRCFRAAVRYFDVPIIVGPQSCLFSRTTPAQLFDGVSNDVHFFCREQYSYDRIDGIEQRNVSVYLDDDTALYLTIDDLPVDQRTNEYSLISFRTDRESRNTMIDESVDPPIVTRDISINVDSFERFVEMAAKATRIYTDRLHVAILSTMLDKPVRFYENSYHKNRGVYEQSLSDSDCVDFVYEDDSVS